MQKLRYIHRNPVSGKWKLADSFLDYPHSSAHFYATGEPTPYSVTDYRTIPYVGDMMAAYVGKKWK